MRLTDDLAPPRHVIEIAFFPQKRSKTETSWASVRGICVHHWKKYPTYNLPAVEKLGARHDWIDMVKLVGPESRGHGALCHTSSLIWILAIIRIIKVTVLCRNLFNQNPRVEHYWVPNTSRGHPHIFNSSASRFVKATPFKVQEGGDLEGWGILWAWAAGRQTSGLLNPINRCEPQMLRGSAKDIIYFALNANQNILVYSIVV